jgi:chromosome segregation ATPase
MAKSIALQLKEALDQVTDLSAHIVAIKADRDAIGASAEAKATELAGAHKTISELQDKLAAAEKRDAEICQELANAQADIERLKASANTVTEAAAQEAQRIVADIGVPPVTAETQPTAPTADDLWAQYHELNLKDSRAAGQFYDKNIRPLILKEK